MAIEKIGSAVAYQVQQAQAQTKTPEVKETPAAKETITEENTPAVDMNISANSPAEEEKTAMEAVNLAEPTQKTNEQIKKAVEEMNKKMFNSEALFGIHEGTNRITIKIVDKETKEVIKELPPEKTLDMIAKAWELAGILVDERR